MSATADAVALPGAPDSATMRRIIWSSVIGTAVEWYDFLIYGAATALVFNHLFFPAGNATLATIAAFGTYAVGFLARPFGAAIFGHFGDRHGRKAMLAATILIMGLGTFAIGLLPTYAQLGIAAPLLLLCLRFLQGIGIGGEWGGAVLMVMESAPVHRRGLMGATVQVGNPIGNLVAIGIFALVSAMPEAKFMSWGWRVPFLVSILLVGVGLFIRMKLTETPTFRALQQRQQVARYPVMEIFRHHRRPFFTAICLKVSEIAWASIAGVFALSYATQQLGMSRGLILNASLLAAVVSLFAIPFYGWLSDHVGRRPMFAASCIFSLLFAFPFFWLMGTRDPMIVTLTIIVAINLGQMVMFGIGAPFYSEMFSARVRYSGASLGFQIGAALSGGLTPFIAASLMAWSHGATWPISLYLMACALITLTAVWLASETARKPLS